MYSSDSDDDRTFIIPESVKAAIATEAIGKKKKKKVTVAAEVESHLDETLPVEYVERCAILIDFTRLFDTEEKDRENPPVECYAQIIHYPLCADFCATDRSIEIFYRPKVKATSMARVAKQRTYRDVVTQVTNIHGIPPDVEGVHPDLVKRDLSTYWSYLKFATTEKTGDNQIFELDENSQNVVDPFGLFVQRALHCCRRDRVEEAVAFLAPGRKVDDVRRSLYWLEQNGADLPRYRVFGWEELAGEAWERYERDIDFMAHHRCTFHRKIDFNKHDNKIVCTRENVFSLWEAIKQGSNLLNEQLEEKTENTTATPFIEDDDEDDD
ncbi:hypothetical protein AGDE_13132 [Angomonas deanei]|uniref:Uncharacterized protein n=1 Tax=Angomonas deanei TaxID=59799 RepID=A0A7G2C9R8_9TRYP|nr:hypothetical protein AGDE_13132 [Angomonas deanei]CAD2215503.1 hypothetical protein, conserved [Angomonas deanei]|eukprot:EPY22659.1 hypothetical protein AGDE_13132 [Angomonas deanei]